MLVESSVFFQGALFLLVPYALCYFHCRSRIKCLEGGSGGSNRMYGIIGLNLLWLVGGLNLVLPYAIFLLLSQFNVDDDRIIGISLSIYWGLSTLLTSLVAGLAAMAFTKGMCGQVYRR